MKVRKYCPLYLISSLRRLGLDKCIEEDCAWYAEEYGCCAIRFLCAPPVNFEEEEDEDAQGVLD
jgi:hypothetical protein